MSFVMHIAFDYPASVCFWKLMVVVTMKMVNGISAVSHASMYVVCAKENMFVMCGSVCEWVFLFKAEGKKLMFRQNDSVEIFRMKIWWAESEMSLVNVYIYIFNVSVCVCGMWILSHTFIAQRCSAQKRHLVCYWMGRNPFPMRFAQTFATATQNTLAYIRVWSVVRVFCLLVCCRYESLKYLQVLFPLYLMLLHCCYSRCYCCHCGLIDY